MTGHWFAGGALAALFATVAALCAVAGWLNVSRFRSLPRHQPPLDLEEVRTATSAESMIARDWPEPDDLTEVRAAAAYRDYAFERRASALVATDTLLTVFAALVGALVVPAARGSMAAISAVFVSVNVVALMAMFRQFADRAWTRRMAMYERRRAALAKPRRRR